MAKNDFDIDFDFEEEYGFDPKAVLGSDFDDEDLDFSDLDDIDLGLDEDEEVKTEPDYSDFDVDSLDLEDLKLSEELLAETAVEEEAEEDLPDEDEDDLFDEEDEALFAVEDFDAEYDPEEEPLMDFSRRATFFDDTEPAQEPVQEPVYEEAPYEQADVEEEISQQLQQMQDVDDLEDEDDEPDDEEEKPAKTRRRPVERKKREPIKITVPPVLMKVVSLYIPPNPKEAFSQQPDPNNPRRRRRKSKWQIIKEAYLPTILACISLILILVFIAGAIGNAIDRKRVNDQAAMESSKAAASESERVAQEAEAIMDQAEIMAAGYDYAGAIGMIDSFTGKMEDYPEMVTMKSEFVEAQSKLVEWKDPNSIPNLAFHVLIADPARAFADKSLGGQYNRNFVTIDEFEKILEQLYKAGYVLVDFDSFTETNTGLDGNANFFTMPIALPEGKKPVMITETMVNYLGYMVDSNEDGEPDAGGAGFAYRMVVDENGDIKAQMVDANGQTQTGNYDLVPILEDFIKAHPDFSYKGARATLAVCGYEGVFGYRTNTSYISSVSQAYYDEQVAGAKQLVEALRDKGYTIACYTYGNIAYGDRSATQIQADLQEWTNQITPVVGNVDVLVYARTSDIGDYGGAKFQVLNGVGFRFFVRHGSQPYAEINNTYVKQSRLMVTGENMAWNSNQFSGMFDCAAILNNLRGNVPKG